MIEEKLSAKNEISATNGVFNLNLTVEELRTSTFVIGRQLPLVKLGLEELNAFSTVYLTSFASIGDPSWHLAPLFNEKVYSVPSAFDFQDFAKFGTAFPSLSVASNVS